MTGDGADRNGMAFASAGALVEHGNVLAVPEVVPSLHDDDISSLDESPFQVVVGLFDHPPVAVLSAAALDLWDGAGVAGQVACSREAVNGPDFERDDSGEDGPYTGQGLDQLHAFGELDPLLDSDFQAVDMPLDKSEKLEFLVHAVTGLLGQGVDQLEQLWAPFGCVDVAGGAQGEGVLGQGGVHAVFERGAHLGEGHAGAGQLTRIADLAGGDPDRGQRAQVLEGGETRRVELVGLVDTAHHLLGVESVGHSGDTTSGFDLIDDPVPISDTLQGDGCAWRELR